MACTKAKDDKGWGPEKGRDKPQETVTEPQPIWGMLYADDAGTVSRSRNSHAKIILRIDSFGSQDGDHVLDDETYGVRVTLVTEAAGHLTQPDGHQMNTRCTNKPPGSCTSGQLCARTPTLLLKSTGVCCWPTYVSDGIVCHCTTNPPHRSDSKHRCSKPGEQNGDHAIRVCHVEPHRGPSRHTAYSSPPNAPPLHRMVEKTSRRLSYAFIGRRTGQGCLLSVKTSRRRCESGGYFSRDSWLVWVATDYPNE